MPGKFFFYVCKYSLFIYSSVHMWRSENNSRSWFSPSTFLRPGLLPLLCHTTSFRLADPGASRWFFYLCFSWGRSTRTIDYYQTWIFFFLIWMFCLNVCLYTTRRGQKRAFHPQRSPGTRDVMWVLEIKPRSSEKAANTLDHWAISPALRLFFLDTDSWGSHLVRHEQVTLYLLSQLPSPHLFIIQKLCM